MPTMPTPRHASSTAPAGRPASKEATMSVPTNDDRVPSRKKLGKADMRLEVCNFAQALLKRGDPPLPVLEALIDGTISFAGRSGEVAMRNYIAAIDAIDQDMARSEKNTKNHDDEDFGYSGFTPQ